MKMSDKSGKLGKLKMPKREEINLDELDMGSEESPEYEASESPEEEGAESEEMEASEHPGELKAVSDEDLLAEVKKRGLMSQLEAETGDESAEDAYV